MSQVSMRLLVLRFMIDNGDARLMFVRFRFNFLPPYFVTVLQSCYFVFSGYGSVQ